MARVRPPNALAASFAETARETIDQWRSRLSELTSGERQVVLWGAGSKGVTFLNVVGRDARITAVVDINPKKIGHFAAGTGHPIVAPEALTDVDVVLICEPRVPGRDPGEADVARALAGARQSVRLTSALWIK